MAVIHVTEAEAARDLPSLLAKVRAGEDVKIDLGEATIAILREMPESTDHKTLSKAIEWADEQNLQLLLDDKFAEDLDQVICNHEHEAGNRTLWED